MRDGEAQPLAVRRGPCHAGAPDRSAAMRMLTPATIAPPFAAYAHGVEVPPGARLVVTSGQLALAADGTVPDGARAQADLCFANCAAILAEAGMGPADVIRINAYVTDRAHMAGYMAARDAWLAGAARLPASTLVIVSGFTRPTFLVEVEVTAARI
jgi:enamine deaminase RidA (YjgF/YER057c/UK114 family)